MKPQKKKKLDYLTRLSFKTIFRLKNWKTRYRNRKSTKAIGTIILILTFLVHLYLDGPFRSADQVRVDDKSIFLILHGLVTLILIASLLAGLINTFRALLWPLIMIRRLFSFFRLVLVGILPKEWRPNFEANVIRRVGIGFLTIVNALIFSIVRPSLEADTKLFFKALITNAQFTDYQISPYVLLFWIVLIGSLIFSFSHYGNEEGQRLTNLEKEEGKQTELLKEIKAAILNVPNEDILHGYHETFYDLRSASNRLDRLIKDNDFKSFESGLNEALKILFEFSKKFLAKGKKEEDLKLCVNFMLHIPREGVNLALLDYCLCNKLYYKELTEDEINAYLLFDGSLNVSSEGYEPPITCLPIVPDNEFMFGAYEALSTSGHSYARNIKKTINIYKERDQEGLYKVSSIFFDAEYGKKIKSLFSIALYASESPIGVLNIHSNQKNYLGKEKLYYPSFVTLMIPLVNLLTNHLHIYQKVLLYSYDSIKLEIND